MAKLQVETFIIPILLAIVLVCAYNYFKYMKANDEHFSGNANAFHPVTDVAPSLCSKDTECDSKKCNGSGYCAV